LWLVSAAGGLAVVTFGFTGGLQRGEWGPHGKPQQIFLRAIFSLYSRLNHFFLLAILLI